MDSISLKLDNTDECIRLNTPPLLQPWRRRIIFLKRIIKLLELQALYRLWAHVSSLTGTTRLHFYISLGHNLNFLCMHTSYLCLISRAINLVFTCSFYGSTLKSTDLTLNRNLLLYSCSLVFPLCFMDRHFMN
jgi:hypothetical protein